MAARLRKDGQPDRRTLGRPRPGGQVPKKLTPAVQERICEYLRTGHYILPACALVGIHRDTYTDWRTRGQHAQSKQDEGLPLLPAEQAYLGFLQATTLARDYGEGWLVEQMFECVKKDPKGKGWTMYCTILERSRPERWRVPSSASFALSAEDGKPFEVKLSFDPKKSTAEDDALRVR